MRSFVIYIVYRFTFVIIIIIIISGSKVLVRTLAASYRRLRNLLWTSDQPLAKTYI
jgi:hypothetical protein